MKFVPDAYEYLLRQLEVLHRIVMSSRYTTIYTSKRTVSKEFTKSIVDGFGFLIDITIEKHVIVCFEIGSHKTGCLCKQTNVSVIRSSSITNQLTPNNTLNWIVGPYCSTHSSCNVKFLYGRYPLQQSLQYNLELFDSLILR